MRRINFYPKVIKRLDYTPRYCVHMCAYLYNDGISSDRKIEKETMKWVLYYLFVIV